jgi:apolipoprotein N-acyltransferase
MVRRWEEALRWLLAVGGGALFALAFPGPGWSGLAWVAPGALLLSAAGHSGVRAFRLGYVGGLVQHLIALGWLLTIPYPFGAVAGWLALSGYVALFQGTWVWLCWHVAGSMTGRSTPGASASSSSGRGISWIESLDLLLAQSGLMRALWVVFCAALWVAIEIAQARFLSGFPWNLAGASQFRMVPIIQLAAWTGIYGVSFLIIWTAVSVGLAIARVLRQPGERWGWMTDLRLPLFVIVGIGCAGMWRLGTVSGESRTVRMALVQPSISQELIWDEREDGGRFNQLLRLSELALATQPQVLVWPEAAFPSLSEENYRTIINLIQRHGVWMVFGADDAATRNEPGDEGGRDYFNAAFLLNPEGRLVARYRKQRLVIFGEYVPLARWLPFLRHFTPIQGSFRAGDGPVDFPMAGPDCNASVLICFEDVFPHLARRHAREGVDVLLNLTNNGWFPRSSAHWQHAASAVFRAVENGLPLIRATNDGLTCWVDAQGRLRQWLGQDSGDIHAAGFLTVPVPLPPAGASRVRTFYNRHGDVFGWSCVGLSMIVVGASTRRRKALEPG